MSMRSSHLRRIIAFLALIGTAMVVFQANKRQPLQPKDDNIDRRELGLLDPKTVTPKIMFTSDGSPLSNLPAEQDMEYELLVLVLAGGRGAGQNERFSWLQSVWLEVARAVKRLHLPVKIYLMTMNPGIVEPRLVDTEGLIIQIPGEDTRLPGCLQMTLGSIEYVQNAKLPGYRHRYLLRTNLSSFWSFPKYLKYINEKFPPGSRGVYDGMLGRGGFVSGSGFLLSNDLETVLINEQHNLRMDRIDDQAIGWLMRDYGRIKATEGRRQNFITNNALNKISMEYYSVEEDQYHFRVKSETKSYPERVLQDKLIMSYLFFQCYGNQI